MRYGPRFEFARRQDGRRVAYQVAGEGDLDLVFLFGWPTHLGLMWEDPSFAGFLGKLSSFSRLILYDRSGGGLSDRGPGGYVFEDEMDDVRAVLEAVGSERAALFGCHTGGRLALLMAATYPDQVSGVVTSGRTRPPSATRTTPGGRPSRSTRAAGDDQVGRGLRRRRPVPGDGGAAGGRRRLGGPLAADVHRLGGHLRRAVRGDPVPGPGGHPQAARLRPRTRPGAAPDRGPGGRRP